jgi:1-aminocyclopropane-1-carboxylate deaminase/D-cysteine desulfhydrase-like pyridoxal-dependent ACC family enzyme
MEIASQPALFRAFPELVGHVPWLSLGRFPTRVHRLDGLLPPSVELWVKREDESGALYGGNKVRKLEFLLAAARAERARRLVTVGAIGSHHVLATAVYGRRAGFSVDAIVFPQPLTDHVREQLLADVGTGARLWPTGSVVGVPLEAWRRRRGGDVTWIAPGGSSPIGTLGYVSAGLELREQEARAELPPIDVIYVALGSCGTAAGLLLGLAAGARGPFDRTKASDRAAIAELVAVRVVDRLVANGWATRRLARATADWLVARGGDWFNHCQSPSLRVEHGQFGGAYGLPTAAGEAAVARAAAAGLMLEPTYTGKAMAALLADADSGRLDGKRVLFLHTFSSAPMAPLVDAGSVDALPPSLRRYFDAGIGASRR